MDLNLIRSTGRAASPLSVEILGEVEESDLPMLTSEGRPSGQSVKITELRDRHHSVARLLAAGTSEWEVSAITGYDRSRISILKNDPAFQDLLAFYRANADAGVADVAARVRDAAATMVTKLVERVEDGEVVEFADLSKATKDLLDRAGYGPKSTKELNINIGLAERVEAARARAIAARQAIPHEVLDLEVVKP